MYTKLIKCIGAAVLMQVCIGVQVFAQQGCSLVTLDENGTVFSNENVILQQQFYDTAACFQYINGLPSRLSLQGYVTASIDSVWNNKDAVFIKLFLGEKYVLEHLRINDTIKNILKAANTQYEKLQLQPRSLQLLYQSVLNYFANNGHPFAKVFFDSIDLSANTFNATLMVDKGPYYKMDSIMVDGEARISGNYLQHYLGIEKMYRQDRLNEINDKLAQLTFLRQYQPWNVEMLNTGAILHLYLEPTTNNEIDVLIGLLPSNQQTGKLLLTGEAKALLQNSFGSGEILSLKWQQLQPGSPQLDLFVQRPYILSSKYGVQANFNLYKRDSAFVLLQGRFGLQYRVSQQKSGSVFFHTSSSNALYTDTQLVKITRQLPETGDVTTWGLGIDYFTNTTDYNFNPRKGNEWNFVGILSNKHVTKNNTITKIADPEFNFNQLYDSVKLNTYQLKVQGAAAHYIPLGRQSTIKIGIQGGWLKTPDYYQNEMFRIGGFRLLRGFDEESIYTNLYGVVTSEYRFLLGKNSWFYGFMDAGAAQNSIQTSTTSHSYVGFGTGLALETKAGVLNISIAEGKRDDTRLDFRQTKIHLGFISLF